MSIFHGSFVSTIDAVRGLVRTPLLLLLIHLGSVDFHWLPPGRWLARRRPFRACHQSDAAQLVRCMIITAHHRSLNVRIMKSFC